MAAVAVYQRRLIGSDCLLLDLAVSSFFAITVLNLVSGLLFKVFLAAMATKHKQKVMAEIMAKK